MTGGFQSALAALAGSAIGGLTTLAVSRMAQRTQLRTTLTSRDRATRHKLYKQFIDEASKLYGDALVNSSVEIPMLVGVYALISRMRVISSPQIVDKAETALRAIVDMYFSPNKTMPELHEQMIHRDKLDLLRDFSSAAREELTALKY